MPRRSRNSYVQLERWRLRKELRKTLDEGDSSCGNGPTAVSSGAHTSQLAVSGPISEECSREIQCLASSLMYLAHVQETDETIRWTFDDVIRAGDALYHRMRHRLELSDSLIGRHLDFDDLPEMVQTDQCQYTVRRCVPLGGFLVQDSPEGRDDHFSLSLRLKSLGTTYSQALLMVGALFVSVFQDPQGQFGFFHSHSPSVSEACSKENRNAGVETFDTVTDLADRLLQFFWDSLHIDTDKKYSLLLVSFSRVTSEHHIEEVREIEKKQKPMAHNFSCYPKGYLQTPKGYLRIAKHKRSYHNSRVRKLIKQQLLKEENKRDALELEEYENAFKVRYYSDPAFRASLYVRNKKERTEPTKKKERRQPTKKKERTQPTKPRYRSDPAQIRERHNQSCRERYKNDPVYRNRQKQRMRLSYKNDPVFRERQKEYARLYYQLKKMTKSVSDQHS